MQTDWTLKVLQILEHQVAIKDVVFALGCVLFLKLAWEIIGKTIDKFSKQKE